MMLQRRSGGENSNAGTPEGPPRQRSTRVSIAETPGDWRTSRAIIGGQVGLAADGTPRRKKPMRAQDATRLLASAVSQSGLNVKEELLFSGPADTEEPDDRTAVKKASEKTIRKAK